MINLTSDDIEDQLDNFIVRKPTEQTKIFEPLRKETKSGQKIHECVPLLVADILQSCPDPDDERVYRLSNSTALNYRTCLVYAYVTGHGVNSKSFYKYSVDDGTGTMEISIFNKPREAEIIKCLYNEAKALVGGAESQQYSQISASMTRLLGKAMEYIDGSVILPGQNVLLFGRPNSFRNKICLDVIAFTVDNERSRKLEIAFADNLIDFYHGIGAT